MDHADRTEPCNLCGCVVHKESCANSEEKEKKRIGKCRSCGWYTCLCDNPDFEMIDVDEVVE